MLRFNDSDQNEQLRWNTVFQPRWLFLIAMIGGFVSIILISYLIFVARIFHLEPEPQVGQASSPTTEKKAQTAWLNPEPLPFPHVLPVPLEALQRFQIPDAEFSLAAAIPQNWDQAVLSSGDIVRFQNTEIQKEYVIYSAGCFGACEDLERNIAESLMEFVRRDHRIGKDPRVVHWHIHHKAWAEFSLLYRDSRGDAWMLGVSTRWENAWLNALRCEYRAPIHFPYEREEVLHLAWDTWVSQFIRLCRNYEVLSWE